MSSCCRWVVCVLSACKVRLAGQVLTRHMVCPCRQHTSGPLMHQQDKYAWQHITVWHAVLHLPKLSAAPLYLTYGSERTTYNAACCCSSTGELDGGAHWRMENAC